MCFVCFDSRRTARRPTSKWTTCWLTTDGSTSISASLWRRSNGKAKVLTANVPLVCVFSNFHAQDHQDMFSRWEVWKRWLQSLREGLGPTIQTGSQRSGEAKNRVSCLNHCKKMTGSCERTFITHPFPKPSQRTVSAADLSSLVRCRTVVSCEIPVKPYISHNPFWFSGFFWSVFGLQTPQEMRQTGEGHVKYWCWKSFSRFQNVLWWIGLLLNSSVTFNVSMWPIVFCVTPACRAGSVCL